MNTTKTEYSTPYGIDENRIKHSLGVARRCYEIAKKLGFSEAEARNMFLLGYVHDIGYEFGDNRSHPIIGSEILRNSNYKYDREIAEHSSNVGDRASLELLILQKADMTVDGTGNVCSIEKRLDTIKEKYGDKSKMFLDAELVAKHLETSIVADK